MDPFLTHGNTNLVLLEGSKLQLDVNIIEGSSSSWFPQSLQKQKRNQATPHVEDYHPFEAVLPAGNDTDGKNKQSQKVSVFDVVLSDLTSASSNLGLKDDTSLDLDCIEVDVDDPYPSDYEDGDDDDDKDEDYDYDDGTTADIDNYEKLAAKFDVLDLPPGVEATLPWLLQPQSWVSYARHIPLDCAVECKNISFKQFDTIQTCSDHFFLKKYPVNKGAKKAQKDWVKRIQYEWKILEKDLPETIFVRACEDRMDLLRAAIVGPTGTPYHDGIFFFDIHFPSFYPSVPPEVHYHSGGLRINPNLYNCGTVCLSLLGTWGGSDCEKWNPVASTMLQVLVSIQGLVLNERPYFNEPAYGCYAGTPRWEEASLTYNEDAFVLSCKTMLYTLRKPPENFEDLVCLHFRMHGRAVLMACLAYINGARVGSALPDEVPDIDMTEEPRSIGFLKNLRKLYDELLMEFTVKGADCNDFLAKKKAKETAAETADNSLLHQG